MALTDYTRDEALEAAHRVVYELLGRRWIWPAVTTTETVAIPSRQTWVSLTGRPIISVTSVIVRNGGSIYNMNALYQIENQNKLRFTSNPQFIAFGCGAPLEVEVTYTYGSPPPLDLKIAIEALADEIFLAYTNPDDCQLPQTVTSITRQGISMTLVNAQDFLDKGRTGISLVDRALTSYNPAGAKRPARVFSVNKPPARRRLTTQAEVTP